jgi:uncharacterized repeat protein (TIGR03803 family)
MITHIKNLFPLPTLLAGFVAILAGPVAAQTFTTLYSFTATSSRINSDGVTPLGLILSGDTLYGMAGGGGTSGLGTVYAVNTDGAGFTTLYSFTGGSDGSGPIGRLILSGNKLYGTTVDYPTAFGTVFVVNTDGTGFTTLYSFTGGSDGTFPRGSLVLSNNTLYGTALHGGSSGNGTVFAVNTDGTGFTTLYSFTGGSDGTSPQAGLLLSGKTLYGTTSTGSSSGLGTVFAVNIDSTGFTVLHSFTSSEGRNPSGLVLSGNTLYGMLEFGGSSGAGTVFAVNTSGTGFTILYSFAGGSDGYGPITGLVLSGNTLYGTAAWGGSAAATSGNGTVFAVNTDGTGFTSLHSFTATSSLPPYGNSDGRTPSGLILSGSTLYGTARLGGSSGNGTVFSISLGPVSPPQLTIASSGANVILTWPTKAAGFTLQSTTNLFSPTAWTTNSPAPDVVNGQSVVTNPISGAQQFYRLSQ